MKRLILVSAVALAALCHAKGDNVWHSIQLGDYGAAEEHLANLPFYGSEHAPDNLLYYHLMMCYICYKKGDQSGMMNTLKMLDLMVKYYESPLNEVLRKE